MPIAQLVIILLFTGAGLGFISGLLGIGGGIIMSPVQYWIYTSAGMSTDVAIKVSFATTLAVVLPTAASGVWQHQRHGSIHWKAAIFMGIFTSIGSFIGAQIASRLPGSTLKIAFGALALLVAIRMLTVKITDVEGPPREKLWLWLALALPIGLITGILGIGGGIIVVPILIIVLRFQMRNAVGTSLAMMLFTSTGGIIGYIVAGLTAPNLPAYSIGYIYWPVWIALTVASVGLAQVGAIMAHKVPGRKLNYLFIALLFGIGLNMLGVFSRLLALI